MKTKLGRTLLLSLLISYISVAVFGFVQVSLWNVSSQHALHHCPFAIGDGMACLMDASTHLGAWKTYTGAYLVMFAVLVAVGVIVFTYASRLETLVRQLFLTQRARPKVTYLTLLFSNGILNPKPY